MSNHRDGVGHVISAGRTQVTLQKMLAKVIVAAAGTGDFGRFFGIISRDEGFDPEENDQNGRLVDRFHMV